MLAIALVALLAGPAAAHKLTVFAHAEGATIHGKAYFHGGAPAQGLEVTALDPNLDEIGGATTNEQGEFSLEARFRCDHHLLVETPDGHGAEFVLKAAQLPADLPPRGETAEPHATRPVAAASAPTPHAHDHDHSHAPAPAPGSAEIAGLRAEIAALREQLTAYEDRTRLRDLLGGGGYILGLAGLAYYFLGRHKTATAGRVRS